MRVACPVDSLNYIKKSAEEAEYLLFFDVEEDEILSEERIQTSKESLISLIASKETDVFLCSNLDVPLMVTLSRMGVELVGGAEGKAKTVLHNWLIGTLECNDIVCSCQTSGGCSGDCGHCHSK